MQEVNELVRSLIDLRRREDAARRAVSELLTTPEGRGAILDAVRDLAAEFDGDLSFDALHGILVERFTTY